VGPKIVVVTKNNRVLQYDEDLTFQGEAGLAGLNGDEVVDAVALTDAFLMLEKAGADATRVTWTGNASVAGGESTFDLRHESIAADRSRRCFIIGDGGAVIAVDAVTRTEVGRITAPSLARRIFNRSPIQPFLSRLAGRNL
jgi:hypothetical protein